MKLLILWSVCSVQTLHSVKIGLGSNSSASKCQCKISPFVPDNLPLCYSDQIEPFGDNAPSRDTEKCFGEPRSSPDDPDLARCLPKEQGQAVYVIGDSFAWAIQFAFIKATSLPVHSASWPCNKDAEGKVNPEVMPAALAKVIKPNDIVVFISNWPLSYSGHLNATKRVTSAHGAKLVILGPWPVLPTQPALCMNTAQLENKMGHGQASKCWQPKAVADERASVLWKKAEMFLDENTSMLDLSSSMCDPSNGCDMWIPGTSLPAYFDIAHVNHNMAHYMAKGICEFLGTKFLLGQLS